jgi:transcriptional regulator with XRE-family HTH domain
MIISTYSLKEVRIMVESDIMIDIGSRLRELRKEKGFTQKEVALKLNIGQTTYAGYENNKSNPDLGMLDQLSNFYNVTTDYLIGKTDIKLTITEMTLLKEIDLDHEELFKKYQLTIDGEPLSRDEFKKAIELIRLMSK